MENGSATQKMFSVTQGIKESVPDQVRLLDTRKTAVRRIVMFDSVNIAGFESRQPLL